MQRKAIVAAQLFTTADLARAIDCTPRGARWIADQAELTCERTPSGQRVFRKADVLRLVEARTTARLRNVRALRPRKLGVAGEPQQLALFAPQRVPAVVSLPRADFTTGGGSTLLDFVPRKRCVR